MIYLYISLKVVTQSQTSKFDIYIKYMILVCINRYLNITYALSQNGTLHYWFYDLGVNVLRHYIFPHSPRIDKKVCYKIKDAKFDLKFVSTKVYITQPIKLALDKPEQPIREPENF